MASGSYRRAMRLLVPAPMSRGPDDLFRHVYVEETDNEPSWCVNGSYLVYCKIRENMPRWEAMEKPEQEVFPTDFPVAGDPKGGSKL